MKKFLILLLALIICFFLYRYFLNRDYIVLNKTSFSDIDEIDTIEAFPEKGLYIVGLVRRGFLGRFSYDLGISKADPKHPTEFVNYEFENNNKSFRVSKDYIAFIKTIGFTNWGWFYVKNGKVMESLPLINKIEDSLRKNTKGFIFSSNGTT